MWRLAYGTTEALKIEAEEKKKNLTFYASFIDPSSGQFASFDIVAIETSWWSCNVN